MAAWRCWCWRFTSSLKLPNRNPNQEVLGEILGKLRNRSKHHSCRDRMCAFFRRAFEDDGCTTISARLEGHCRSIEFHIDHPTDGLEDSSGGRRKMGGAGRGRFRLAGLHGKDGMDGGLHVAAALD